MIILRLQSSEFFLDQEIVIDIENTGADPVAAMDHQSACSIVSLQRIDQNGNWNTLLPCRMGIMTRFITIDPGMTVSVQLRPGAGTLQNSAQWEPGVYKVVFRYFTGNILHGIPSESNATTISTPVFTIHEK